MPVRFLLPFPLERIYANSKSISKERILLDNVPRSTQIDSADTYCIYVMFQYAISVYREKEVTFI